jgi:hypothetical protein
MRQIYLVPDCSHPWGQLGPSLVTVPKYRKRLRGENITSSAPTRSREPPLKRFPACMLALPITSAALPTFSPTHTHTILYCAQSLRASLVLHLLRMHELPATQILAACWSSSVTGPVETSCVAGCWSRLIAIVAPMASSRSRERYTTTSAVNFVPVQATLRSGRRRRRALLARKKKAFSAEVH